MDRGPDEPPISYITPGDLADAFRDLYGSVTDLDTSKQDALPMFGNERDVLTFIGGRWVPDAAAGSSNMQGVLTGAGTPLPTTPKANSMYLLAAPVPTAVTTALPTAAPGHVIEWDGNQWVDLGALIQVAAANVKFALGNGTNGTKGHLYYTETTPTPAFTGTTPGGWTDAGLIGSTELPPYTAADAQKLLAVKVDGTLEWKALTTSDLVGYYPTEAGLRADTPANPGFFAFADDTDSMWWWDGAAWHEVGGVTVMPATSLPLVAGTAAVGTSALYAREDHIHPTELPVHAVANNGQVLAVDPTGAVVWQNPAAAAAPTSFKGGVVNAANLPATAVVGDVYVTLDNGHLHVFTTTTTADDIGPAAGGTLPAIGTGTGAPPVGAVLTNVAGTPTWQTPTPHLALGTAPGAAPGTAAAGTAADAAHSDHVHPAPPAPPAAGTSLPLVDGLASVGASAAYAHEDHIHPSELPAHTAAQKDMSLHVAEDGTPIWKLAFPVVVQQAQPTAADYGDTNLRDGFVWIKRA